MSDEPKYVRIRFDLDGAEDVATSLQVDVSRAENALDVENAVHYAMFSHRYWASEIFDCLKGRGKESHGR